MFRAQPRTLIRCENLLSLHFSSRPRGGGSRPSDQLAGSAVRKILEETTQLRTGTNMGRIKLEQAKKDQVGLLR